jgi:hypothetical protein
MSKRTPKVRSKLVYMTLNTWWNDDPSQRYWMQITDRPDLNGPLLAPKLPRQTWGYDLVSQVQPGDRVLHWRADARQRGLVGWSEVEEYATVIPEYTWSPHHGGGHERTTLGWSAAVGQFHAFPSRVTSGQLLLILDRILAIDDFLSTQHKGPIYFPITRYGSDRPTDRQGLRVVQAYFAKFPVELFDVIPGISSARLDVPIYPTETDLPEDFQPPRKKAPTGRTTRAQDPALRAAVERRSLDVAKDYYEKELHGSDYKEVGKPYDIRVTVQGVSRRCEVKGSSMEIDTVELTPNEVEHGITFAPIDLIVVDNIIPVRDPETGVVTHAMDGRRRVWADWTPHESGLKVTAYAYTLPNEPTSITPA